MPREMKLNSTVNKTTGNANIQCTNDYLLSGRSKRETNITVYVSEGNDTLE